MVSGNLYQSNAMVGQRIMKEIGATGVPVINVANACATGSTAFREAYYAVASGAYDIALAVGSEQMGKMGLLGGGGGGDRAYSTEGVMGTGLMPGVFGQAGVEHMRKYGTTQEQIAKIARQEPRARRPQPLRAVPEGDAARGGPERARGRLAEHAVHVLPHRRRRRGRGPDVRREGQAVHDEAGLGRRFRPHLRPLQPSATPRCSTSTPSPGSPPRRPTRRPASAPRTSDMVELHDCFATAELVHYENLGLCGEGEAGKLIDDKETYNGGKIPVNVSGGLLSKGHPLGATGVANIVEVVWHLRGEAGARQVKGAKTGLAHVIGLGSACTINILKK